MPDALIAVVDDDDMVRRATSSFLRSLGYETVLFTGPEAFLASDASGVDCIVSDVQMPGMSGLEMHRMLRERGQPIPVVLMTAYLTKETNDYARNAEIVALLEKPLVTEDLIAAVGKALATRSA